MIIRLPDMTMLDFSLWKVLVNLPIERHTKGLNGVELLEPTPPDSADTKLGV